MTTVPNRRSIRQQAPTWNGRIHPLAEMFPRLGADGGHHEQTTEDIGANGLVRALTLDADGTLVDGVNRLHACETLGVPPRFEVLPEGTDVADYVISVNIARRHLDAGQRLFWWPKSERFVTNR